MLASARRAGRLLGLGRAGLVSPSTRTLAPQPEPASGDEEDGGAVERRLAEMAAGGWGASAAAPPLPSPPTPWPSPAETARLLRAGSSSQASASSSGADARPPPAPVTLPTLPWREAVALARASGLEGGDPLVDSFGRRHTYLRLSLTEKCNLRCGYCMPADGVALTPRPHLLTTPELARLAALFARAGVTKARLTGGEPTLRRDVADIARALATTPGIASVALTTNGVNLAGPRLAGLAAAGVSAWNISLDTLRPERFAALTRRSASLHASVVASIAQAAALPHLTAPVKVNVVLMRGVNDDELPSWARFACDAGVNVRFIEYMPFTGNAWDRDRVVPWVEAFAAVDGAVGGGGLVRVADPAGEVAKNFVPASSLPAGSPPPTALPLRSGSLSFVTSMTDHFCGGCNRVRLMADGALKVCLFGAGEVSLRDALRDGATDEELRLVVAAALSRKKAAHAGLGSLAGLPNREMVRIGG